MRTILTPCVKKCEIDSTTSFCLGCGRTIQQLREWRIYTDEQRINIMNNLKRKEEPKDGLEQHYHSNIRTS